MRNLLTALFVANAACATHGEPDHMGGPDPQAEPLTLPGGNVCAPLESAVPGTLLVRSEQEIDDIQGLRTVASVAQAGHYRHFVLDAGGERHAIFAVAMTIDVPFQAGDQVWVDMTIWPAFNSEWAGVIRDAPGGRLLLAFVGGWLERIKDPRFHTAELDVQISGTCPAIGSTCGTIAHHELEYAGSGDPLFLFGEAQGELELDERPYTVYQSMAFTGATDAAHPCLDGPGSAIGFVVAAQGIGRM